MLYSKIWFFTWEASSWRFYSEANRRTESVVGILRIALRLRDRYVFMWHFLNALNTLTLKQVFWKTKTFFKKWKYCFLDGSTTTFRTTTGVLLLRHFRAKLTSQRLILRQIEWGAQNGLIKEQVFATKYFIF